MLRTIPTLGRHKTGLELYNLLAISLVPEYIIVDIIIYGVGYFYRVRLRVTVDANR